MTRSPLSEYANRAGPLPPTRTGGAEAEPELDAYAEAEALEQGPRLVIAQRAM